MVFSSHAFLLGFLPIVYLLFLVFRRQGNRLGVVYLLIAASLVFYAWWNPSYLALILGSIIVNYLLGRVLGQSGMPNSGAGRSVLAGGIVLNLGTIAYYKYAGFFAATYNGLTGGGIDFGDIILPLAISFFTFQQIAFLVDSYRGETREYRFADYALYVLFFPQLIAGPIVYHRESIPQFQSNRFFSTGVRDLSVGLSMLMLGLTKKVLLADNLAVHANAVFDSAARGEPIDALTAWTGAFAYTFQLYFDFSGYSDMAIGLARMFGIKLPFNFNSPYKALNIVDFWRRWHITLSRFLREYLYIPLGGNRRGPGRRYCNLLLTMAIGGLWHGAGWTFVIWGLLHGGYLCINHAWQVVLTQLGQGKLQSSPIYGVLAWSATFVAVVVGWVFFRAADLETALSMVGSMAQPWQSGVSTAVAADRYDLALIAVSLAIVLVLPNTQQWMRLTQPLGERAEAAMVLGKWNVAWCPGWSIASALAVLGFASLYAMQSGSEFLYFRF